MRRSQPTSACFMMLVLFLVASFSPMLDGSNSVELESRNPSSLTAVGEVVEISIPVYPNGSSNQLKVEIPGGEALQELDLELQPRAVPIVEEFTWETSAHFNSTAAVFDNVDYNKTGMTILPRGFEWDFETSNHGWSLASAGGWLHGSDTTSGSHGLSGGVHGGAKAIYTYQGDYPNYMGSTYWATSPPFDCTGCSGSWEFSFWKRLGVESSSWDHAYVQIKNPQGTWVNLWSNSGTINDGSYNLASYSVGTYIANNPSAQVRFGMGTTDGSVTYTGWNIDDVSILPSGGVSGGFANWTSPDFGPSAITGVSSIPGSYGIMSLDSVVPSGASLEWTIIDANTLSPIAGFVDRTESFADLGIIDWETHPSLRLKIAFIAGSGGAPHLHSVNLQGRVVDDFFANPSDDGWSMGGASWSSTDNRIYGTSSEVVLTPVYDVARPISRIRTDMITSGSTQIQYSVDGEPWKDIQPTVTEVLDTPALSVQLKISGGGSYWQLDRLEVDLQSAGMPIHPRIDVGLDNKFEWEIPGNSHGQWGLQNRLGNGYLGHKMIFNSPATRTVSVLLPTEGVEGLVFDMTPVAGITNGVDVEFDVGSSTIIARNIGDLDKSTLLIASSDDILQINAALQNASSVSSGEGYSMALLDIKISAAGGSDLIIRGLRAPYSPTAIISADGDHALVKSINEIVSTQSGGSSTYNIAIPLQTDMPGGYAARIVRAATSIAPNVISFTMTNVSQSEPLTPSWQWIEASALFDTQEDPQRVVLDFSTTDTYLGFDCSLSSILPPSSQGEMPGNCQGMGDYEYIQWHPLNPMEKTTNETLMRIKWSFRLEPTWDDEDALDVRTTMVTVSGIHTLPGLLSFGSGSTNGIENDITLVDWWVVNQNGDQVTQSALFLSPGTTVEVVAKIGFEGVGGSWSPRSEDVEVSLWQDGVEINSTRQLDGGLASMTVAVPNSGAYVTWEVRLSPIHGQSVEYSTRSYTFQTDSLSPEVIGMSIDRHDHLSPSTEQRIEFTIYDRPVLPESINLYLWKEWVNDLNQDGLPNSDEYFLHMLQNPSDLSESSSNYILTFDDTSALDGNLVAGYLTGADPAGNQLMGGGGSDSDQHLFMYQVLRDVAPNVLGNQVHFSDGQHSWLHPETLYTLHVPIEEGNGMSDIATTRVELSSNSQDDVLAISWDGETQRCSSETNYLLIDTCVLGASVGNTTPYSTSLEMVVTFQLQWTLLPDSYISREPAIEVVDRAGQSSYTLLPEMRWRYSPDMMIDRSSLNVSIDESVPNSEGAWVRPGASATIRGEVMWASDGNLVDPPVDVAILLDGKRHTVLSLGGGFAADIDMPLTSGDHPLNVELANIPTNAADLTDRSTPVMWIVVDGESPVVMDVLSPRSNSILSVDELEELEIDVRVKEQEQLNKDSLKIMWRVQPLNSEPGALPVAEGFAYPNMMENRLSGLSIPVVAFVDIASSLESGADLNALELIVWVVGSDMAGNDFDNLLNSEVVPLGVWEIEQRAPYFTMERNDIEYSKFGDLTKGESVTVSVTVHNVGNLGGQVEVLVEEVRPGGERVELDQTHLYIDAGSHNTSDTIWNLDDLGAAWIEATIIGTGELTNGPTLRIVEDNSDGFLGTSVAGVDNTYILLAFGLLIVLSLVVVALMRQSGSGDTWVDDEEWEDDTANQTELVNHAQNKQSASNNHYEEQVDPYAQTHYE